MSKNLIEYSIFGNLSFNLYFDFVELNEGTELKDMDALKSALQLTKTKNVENRLTEEVVRAKAMLDRLRNIARLMHAVLGLDQKTIAEIKGRPRISGCAEHALIVVDN